MFPTSLLPLLCASFFAATPEEIVESSRQVWNVPGVAVCIVKDQQIVLLQGFGTRQLNQNSPVDADTLFPIASCTKAFSAALIAQLAQAKKLSWDTPISTGLPIFQLADPKITPQVTFRDCFSHRTGIDGHDFMWYRADQPFPELIPKLKSLPFSAPFRTEMQYQTLVVIAASLAAEKVAQKSWADQLQQDLLQPLQMKRTGVISKDALEDANHAIGHWRQESGKQLPIPWYPHPTPNPGGSIHSCARDLAHWLQFQLNAGIWNQKELLQKTIFQEMHQPQIQQKLDTNTKRMFPTCTRSAYGLGWVIQDYRGKLFLGHSGISEGFRAQITLVPEMNLGIAILANQHATRMNLALTNRLIDHYLNVPAFNWDRYFLQIIQEGESNELQQIHWLQQNRVQGLPQLPLKQYVGTYQDDAYGKLQIQLVQNQLQLVYHGMIAPLEHVDGDQFVLRCNNVMNRLPLQFVLVGDAVQQVRLFDRSFHR